MGVHQEAEMAPVSDMEVKQVQSCSPSQLEETPDDVCDHFVLFLKMGFLGWRGFGAGPCRQLVACCSTETKCEINS